jgi:hypothetical protein
LSDELLSILWADRLLAVDARLQQKACAFGRRRHDRFEILPWRQDDGLLALRRRRATRDSDGCHRAKQKAAGSPLGSEHRTALPRYQSA